MTIELWWPQLRPETQRWLIANNGDAVTPAIMAEIAAVGGPEASEVWWVHEEGSPGRCMPDEAMDWIEAVANDETGG